jgi:hypothetical protein
MQHSRFVTGLSLAALLLAAATNGEARIASSIAQKMDRLMTLGRHLAPQGRDRQRAIGVSPSTREAILRRRAAQESRTLAQRVRYNRAAAMQRTQGELTGDLPVSRSLTESQRC